MSLIIVKVMAAPSPGCEAGLPEVPHPGRHHRFEVVVADPGMGEVMRSYVLHLPAHYNTHNTDPTPLMIVGDFIHVEMSTQLKLRLRITTAGQGRPTTRW